MHAVWETPFLFADKLNGMNEDERVANKLPNILVQKYMEICLPVYKISSGPKIMILNWAAP
jgi:hypothetical protein